MPPSLDGLAGAPGRVRPEAFALVASSAGLEAVAAVLRALPDGFPAAGLVALEVNETEANETEADDGEAGALAALRRATELPVAWAEDGERLRPGTIRVCPPGMGLEVLPDETLALGPADRPLDGLLASLGESLGSRAAAVVLGGGGEDGAAGALALSRGGGTVVVQSEETAQEPDLPLAVVGNGAARLALPLHDIGPLLAAVAAGASFPLPSAETRAAEALFGGAGEMAEILRATDWSRTPFGPVSGWPPALRTALRIVLESPMPAVVLWTRDLLQVYNAPYRELMGDKHPGGLGQANRECWPEVWSINEPLYERVFRGESVGVEDALYPLMRHGALHDVWLTVYSVPIRGEAGEVAGVMVTVIDTTEKIVAARRFGTLQALSNVRADTEEELGGRAAAALALNPDDAPFALVYRLNGQATLMGRAGVAEGSPAAPPVVELGGGHPAWPLAKVAKDGEAMLLTDLAARFRGLGLPPSALLLPLPDEGEGAPLGVLVVGINPRQPLDGAYRGFLDLVASRLGAGLAATRARAEEAVRRERAAELDWAKNEFFANVSHEFRTPLTLMLAPLEELLYRREELPHLLGDEVEVASRSARRLLTLVNTLLDFSQIESGRLRPQRRVTDLAALTREVAGLFRSAAERAGLRLRIDCPPLSEPTWVDAEMWERIVSNLVSNALKFTFEGEVSVALRELPGHVELVVRDTGVGIPRAEIPNLFKRFHRVRGTRARTLEGSGVGLALVHELARLHGGRVRAQSVEGQGSAFTVWVPRESGSVEDVLASRAAPVRRRTAETLAGEAARWGAAPDPFAAPSIEELSEVLGEPLQVRGVGARVLVVDDNADMRDYLSRLLAPHWDVETAVDGADALRRARQDPPHLILADMAMPNLSGADLVRQVREDAALKDLPIVLLTARAGEESAVEGLLAGADDYLVKPFVARELIARVGAQIELARVRGRAKELNEILVRFSDAVRGSTDPLTVARTACRLVAEKLGVERAYWAEVDWTTREYAIGGSFHVPGVSVVEGRFPIDAWEPFTSSHLAGRPVVVDDTQADPRVPPEVREGYARIEVGADLAVPVTADGRLVCTFAVNQRRSRRWTPEEVALVEGVANRCWAEVVRARAEAARRESEEKLSAIFAQAAVGLSEIALDGRFRRVNDELCRILGRSRDELLALTVEDVTHPDDLPASRDALARLVATGEPVALDKRYVRADGTLLFANSSLTRLDGSDGRPRAISAVTVDLTERRRAEATEREYAERQAFLLEFSDALRPLDGAAEIQGEAARRLRERLAAGWCYYVEWDEAAARGDVLRDATRDGLPSLAGTHDVSDVPGFLDLLRKGNVLNVRDYAGFDALSPELRARYTALGFRSMLVATLVKQGRLVASLLVGDTEARDWSGDAEALLTEVAERTWAAVERARAETALRAGERRARIQSEAFQSAMNGESLARSLRTLTRIVHEELGGGVRTAFYLAYPDGERLHAIDGAGDMPTPYTGVVDGLSVGPDSLCSGKAIATGRPAFTRDVREDAQWGPYLGLASAHGFRGASSYPILTAEGRSVGGSLALYFPEVHEETPQEAAVAEAVTRAAAIILSRHTEATERKRAEEALRASNARFGSIANLVPDLLWSSRPDGYTEWYNQRWSEYTGQTFEGAIGWGWTDAIHPDDRADSGRRYREAVESGRTLVQEHRIRRHDGEYRWFLVRAEPVRDEAGDLKMFGSATDIHAQRTTLATVRESEERQAFLLGLSDALRPLVAPAEVRAAAARRLGERLGAHRAFYAEVEGGDWWVAEAYEQGVERQAEGRHPMAAFGRWIVDLLQEGRRLIVRDLHADARFDASGRAAHEAYRILGAVAVPLVKAGALVAILVVHSAVPRDWTEAEIALVEETAERTWAAVERARAEQTLRESEERNALLVRFTDVARGLSSPGAIAREACRLVAERLGAPRVLWATVDHAAQEYVADHVFLAGGGSVEPSRWPLDVREAFVAEHLAGRPVVYDDIAEDPRVSEAVRSAMLERGIRSGVVAPVLVGGTLLAVLSVSRPTPSRWKPEQVALVEALAGPAWAEIERARAEEALRQREAELARVQRIGEFGGIDVDIAGGLVARRSPEYLRIHGLPADMVDETHDEWLARIVPEDRQRADETLRRALAGSETRYENEYRIVRPSDGEVRWIRARADIVRDESGRAIRLVGAHLDVTDPKRMEAAIRQNEARLGAVVQTLPGGAAFVVDRDLRYRMAEGEALAAAGLRSEDLVGKTVAEAMPPEIVAAYEASYRRVLAGGTFEVEHEAHGRSFVSRGVPLPAPDGTIDAALVVSYDITERKRAEAALSESRGLFDAALSSLPHHVFVLDAAGRFLYVNESLLDYWGLARSEALGRTPLELGHSPGMAAQIDQALATGRPVSGTFYHPGPTAPEAAYEYVYTPFGGAGGGADRVVGWSREIDPVTRVPRARSGG